MKQHMMYIFTLLLSIGLLVAGNRLASTQAHDSGNVQEAIYYTATIVEIVERSERDLGWGSTSIDIDFTARITTRGSSRGQIITARQQIGDFVLVNEREVSPGDRVVLFHAVWGDSYYFVNYVRMNYIAILGIVFVALVLLLGRKKGFNSLVALGLTCFGVFWVFIPAILSGRNIYIATLIICSYVILTTLLIVIGSNKKTYSAMIGCFAGVLVAGGLMLAMDMVLRLTGALDTETEALLLLPTAQPINLRAIIFAGVIIGAVGAIMDVAMSIASSLWELKEAGGVTDFKSIATSGVNIGKDILGTMLNTLILAYIGSSLSVILLLNANSQSLVALFTREMIIVEFLRALVGSFGMLLTIPITACICGWLYQKKAQDTP